MSDVIFELTEEDEDFLDAMDEFIDNLSKTNNNQ